MTRLFGIGFAILLAWLSIGIVSSVDLTTGLVGYWPLDGSARDVVGGSDGVLIGDPEWKNGHTGQGIELDGSQYVNVPGFYLTTNTITFVAWINGWKTVAWSGIVSSREPMACEMIFGDNDTLHYVWNNDSFITYQWADGPVIPQNEWAMVALTIEPQKATAYVYHDVNGLTQGVNEITHVEQTLGVLNIGWADSGEGDRFFKGIIDEVMIYNRALTAEEILHLATKGLGIDINLKPGWNLFSFSVNKCFYGGTLPPDQPDCVEKVNINSLEFGSLAEWFSSIITPSDAWQMIIGSSGAMDSSLPSAFHSLKSMSPCSGYWVKIKEGGAILSLNGLLFDPSCPILLKEGWNLVGCPVGKGYHDTASSPVGKHVPGGTIWEQKPNPVADYVFSSIAGKYDMIIGEDGAYNPNLPSAFSSLHYIAPGYGYWIKMKEAADLIYP